MKIFQTLYDKMLHWAEHKYAQLILFVVSFSESVFFPIPPDVMLAPMALSSPNRAWYYAGLTTLASVLGGAVGYLLGYWLYEPVALPLIEALHYQDKMAHIQTWFEDYGIWVVFIAGFSPIPYKVFTISAGLMQMMFIPFILASAIGRGMRFYLVAGLMYWGGAAMRDRLREFVDLLGWALVALVAIGIAFYKFVYS